MDVLQGLQLSSKGKLAYDVYWEPTIQALQQCSLSPEIGIEFTSVIEDLNCDIRRTEGSVYVDSREESRCEITEQRTRQVETIPKQLESDSSVVNKPGKYKPGVELTAGPEQFDVTHVHVYRYIKEKDEEVRERAHQRAIAFETHSEDLREKKRVYLQKRHEERKNEFDEDVQSLQEALRSKSEEGERRQKALEQRHKESAARAVRKMKEVEEFRLKLLAEEKKNKEELLELHAMNEDIQAVGSNLVHILTECQHGNYLPLSTITIMEEAQKVLTLSGNTFSASIEMGRVTDGAIKHLQEYSEIIKALLNKARAAVAEADAKVAKEAAEAEAKRREEEEKKKEAEKQKAKVKAAKEKAAAVPNYLLNCISDAAYKEFTRLEKLLERTEKSYKDLATSKDGGVKKLKLDLSKAVTTPINTVSDYSPSHLLEKIQALTKLLNGQQVMQAGKSISTSDHQLAPVYCRDVLAKKIVQQGSQQVASNHNAAFPVAALAIGLWASFPEVGDLVLAHFYKQCPFLVPLYIPKAEGTSDKDYFMALGYQCTGDEIEPADKYLKRMTGTIRLYAAIVSSMPPKRALQRHPHGIAHGWTWLARVLNMPPRPDYTATAIYEFLEVAGHALAKQYRNQFWKLLIALCKDFLPRIEQVSSPAQSGPVVRLKGFLQKSIQSRAMEVPEGYLTPHWWNTSSGPSGAFGY